MILAPRVSARRALCCADVGLRVDWPRIGHPRLATCGPALARRWRGGSGVSGVCVFLHDVPFFM